MRLKTRLTTNEMDNYMHVETIVQCSICDNMTYGQCQTDAERMYHTNYGKFGHGHNNDPLVKTAGRVLLKICNIGIWNNYNSANCNWTCCMQQRAAPCNSVFAGGEHPVKCSLIRVNSSATTYKMRTSLLSSSVCWNTMHLTNNHTLHHISCKYFGLGGVTVTAFTETTISRLEIIMQRRSYALLTRLKMLYTTSDLRCLVDGVASIYQETLQCFGTTFILLQIFS